MSGHGTIRTLFIVTGLAVLLCAGWGVSGDDEKDGKLGKPGKVEVAGESDVSMKIRPGMGSGIGEADPMRMASMRVMFMERILNKPEMAARLGLTPDQAIELKSAMAKSRKERDELTAAIQKITAEEVELIAVENTDEAKVLTLVEKAGDLNTKRAKLVTSQLLLIKRSLTAEQIAKLRDLAKEHGRNKIGNEIKDRHQENVDRRKAWRERPVEPPVAP